MVPPPAKGSWKAGSFSGLKSEAASGWLRFSSQVSRHDFQISARAAFSTASLFVFSQTTKSSMILNSRSRSFAASTLLMPRLRCLSYPGSFTSWAKRTALAAASGRRAHHRCNVLGCPWRIDFSRAAATLILSSGNATSMSLRGLLTAMFLLDAMGN